MDIRSSHIVLLSTLGVGIVLAADAFATDRMQFTDFPASATYDGNPARIDESTAPGNWGAVPEIDREIIADGMADGPNFAGSYYLATVGCGTGCEAIFAIDLRDGRIHAAPEPASNGVVFRPDSRLVIIKEDKIYNLPRVNLVFENGEFRTVD